MDRKLPTPSLPTSIINIRLTVLEIMFAQGSGTPDGGRRTEK